MRPRKDDDSDNEVPEDRDETPSNDSQSAESGPSEDDDESEIGEDVRKSFANQFQERH